MSIKVTRRGFIMNAVGLAAFAGTACATPGHSNEQSNTQSTEQEAERVVGTFDLHCDTIDALAMVSHKPYADFKTKHKGSLISNDGTVSADRMGDAQWVQCYSIWIPPTEGEDSTEIKPIQWYREAVAWFKDQMESCGDKIIQVRDFSQVTPILEEGKVPAILTVENASCLEEGVGIVDEFAKDGVMIASLTWNDKNALGSGTDNPDVGLTSLARKCIDALEEHNITLDVSHLNDKCFWDLDAVASKPYIATHSNSRAVCNNIRNLTDDQFLAIAERGGVVGLSYYGPTVHDGDEDYSFEELARHVEHWLDLDGESVIALGSDRDGAEIPEWLGDCSKQASLYDQFVDRFGQTIAHELFFDNAIRFFGAA